MTTPPSLKKPLQCLSPGQARYAGSSRTAQKVNNQSLIQQYPYRSNILSIIIFFSIKRWGFYFTTMDSIKPDRYAVMGNPIAHSKSPQIHALFAQQTHQHVTYTALLVALDQCESALQAFAESGGKGLNITVPFKHAAWQWVAQRSSRAQRAGAVNTILFRPDGIHYGDNTDGIGLVRDLKYNHDVTIQGQRVLLLGAGGAVRGVLQPLLEEHPARLVIANRTAEKAVRLAKDLTDVVSVTGCAYEDLGQDLDTAQFDIIINGTSASLQGEVPAVPATVLTKGCLCYDMMYGAAPTAFMQWAKQHGVGRAVDGLGMLVEQAAESFFLWRGVRPTTAPVIATLRAQMRK